MQVQLPYMKGHGGKTWVSMIGASQESQGAQDSSTWPVIIYHALRYVVRPYTHMLRIQLSLLREKERNLSEPGSPLTQRVKGVEHARAEFPLSARGHQGRRPLSTGGAMVTKGRGTP